MNLAVVSGMLVRVWAAGRATCKDKGLFKKKVRISPIAAKYGLVVPCMGDQFEVLHGSFDRQSMILLQFPSEDAYRGFWSDPDYLPIKKLREDNTENEHIAFPSGFSTV